MRILKFIYQNFFLLKLTCPIGFTEPFGVHKLLIHNNRVQNEVEIKSVRIYFISQT